MVWSINLPTNSAAGKSGNVRKPSVKWKQSCDWSWGSSCWLSALTQTGNHPALPEHRLPAKTSPLESDLLWFHCGKNHFHRVLMMWLFYSGERNQHHHLWLELRNIKMGVTQADSVLYPPAQRVFIFLLTRRFRLTVTTRFLLQLLPERCTFSSLPAKIHFHTNS